MILFGTCGNGRPFYWESSDVLCSEDKRKVYQNYLHFAATLVLSGNNYRKGNVSIVLFINDDKKLNIMIFVRRSCGNVFLRI